MIDTRLMFREENALSGSQLRECVCRSKGRDCCHIKSSIPRYPTKHTQAILCCQAEIHRSSSSHALPVQAEPNDENCISGL
ncbi:MAG: hypothetical protein WA977_01070 [Halobacteriota archaeon]